MIEVDLGPDPDDDLMMFGNGRGDSSSYEAHGVEVAWTLG